MKPQTIQQYADSLPVEHVNTVANLRAERAKLRNAEFQRQEDLMNFLTFCGVDATTVPPTESST